jgi:hypothetical protein
VSDAPERAIKRNLVVQRWGTPHLTVGSVNEPREMTEHGCVFNEKWIYRAPVGEPARPRERMIYWHRYDFVASFLVDGEGRLARENPQVLLADLHDRLYCPPGEGGTPRPA